MGTDGGVGGGPPTSVFLLCYLFESMLDELTGTHRLEIYLLFEHVYVSVCVYTCLYDMCGTG